MKRRQKDLSADIFIIAATTAAMIFLSSAKPHASKPSLTIHFQNYVGSRLLQLDSTEYRNSLGQPYTISKFKYYIGEIALLKSNGQKYQSHGYFLVNEEDESSKNALLKNVPSGQYDSISFIIGVDSLHNCSGAQTGALDPINGMFWAWNTGYIFLKLEGHSSFSKSPGNILEYHIGGYRNPNNCVRKVTLPLKALKVDEEGSQLTLKANAAALFESPTQIDFSQISSVTDFHNATMFAGNYATMFSVRE